jgi:putative hemolysin
MPIAILIMLLLLAGLLVASGFFSGSETALFSLTRHQRIRLERADNVIGRTVTQLLAETRGLLITLLLGNMTINVLYFVISTMLLIRLSEAGLISGILLAAATLAPLLLIILFGEVLPKLVASNMPEGFAKAVSLPLFVLHRIIAPIRIASSVAVITPLSRLLAPPRPSPDLSPEELESMLSLSQHHGVIDHDEQRVLEQVLALSRLKVSQLMIPRVDIQAFDLDDDPATLIELFKTTRVKQVPAYRGDLDHVEGLLHGRQVLLARPQTREEVEALVRQVQFVPELQRADRLLIELRKSGTTVAMVVDEFGGTSGLITLEDIVEHLVGDLPGEFDTEGEPEVTELQPGVWRVDADLAIHDWPGVFGRHARFEQAHWIEAARTVGGLVMAQVGRVPVVGDHVQLGNVLLTVDAMDGHRVEWVRIELATGQGPAASQMTESNPRGSQS